MILSKDKTPRSQTSVQPISVVSPDSQKPGAAAALIGRFNRWLDRSLGADHEDLRPMFDASSKDEAANRQARKWAGRYLAADEATRLAMLTALTDAGVALDNAAEADIRLFRRLYAQSDSLALMVTMRADMLRWQIEVPGLSRLEQALATLLSNWFDVGMLELRHINWDSPASLLEKLIKYEAVHEIRSWEDMRRRVADDRRCYAYFHPRMSGVPLIFVEVALAGNMVGNIQTLLDPAHPIDPLHKARWAIFYSISTTQPGLRGISFGNFLLKRVIEELKAELPKLKSFATLSPIPGFAKWLLKQSQAQMAELLVNLSDPKDLLNGAAALEQLREAQFDSPAEIKRIGMRLVARYLTGLHEGQPLDPVARFHLGNGARIERVNWAADLSVKGLEQSCGMMVNYLYEPDQLDENRAHLEAGAPRASRAVQRL